jgi:hypothetical protein
MGFFSKTCAKSHHPVIHHGYGNDWHKKYPQLFDIVVLYPDGRKLEGVYDGYGRVDGQDICPNGYDHDLWEKLKFVLKSHYNGETYDQVGKSHDELAQGHFMSEDFALYCVMRKPQGFKTYAEYKKAFKKYAGWL